MKPRGGGGGQMLGRMLGRPLSGPVSLVVM
jgi:hypothetical protein